MALQLSNYDPAVKAGAQIDLPVDLTDITDGSGNEIAEFDTVTSAVNYLRVSNSATTGPIELSAQGDDSNIGIQITPKGSGTVRFVTATPLTITQGGAVDFEQLSRSEAHFVIRTSAFTPLTTPGRTTNNTTWVEVRLDTPSGTRRFIQVYD